METDNKAPAQVLSPVREIEIALPEDLAAMLLLALITGQHGSVGIYPRGEN